VPLLSKRSLDLPSGGHVESFFLSVLVGTETCSWGMRLP
jgi:hypothetical protein